MGQKGEESSRKDNPGLETETVETNRVKRYWVQFKRSSYPQSPEWDKVTQKINKTK